MLYDICISARRLTEDQDQEVSIFLLENIVKNYLGLKSMVGSP